MTYVDLHRTRRNGLGRRPYVSPSVRRARRQARIAAAIFLLFGLGCSFLAYSILGMKNPEQLAGLGMILGIASFGSFALCVVAAMEA